jgi:pimeloyl-ACP methyl ester carboxylesterase
MADPLTVSGAINLAGPLDLTANIQGYETLCRDSVITSLMGGTPAAVAERYGQASPIELLPLGVPQVLIWGTQEDFVPRPFVDAYVAKATRAGDQVRLIVIPGAGHFETANPRAFTWPRVEAAIRELLQGRLPAND